MLQIFRNNFLLKVLSVTLALAGWGYFKFANSPVTAAPQQLSIPITTTHLAVGYLAHYEEKEAVVTVAAPKRGSAAVRPDDVKAVLDLGGLQAGVYNVPVRLVAPSAVVQSLSPASVTLTIARLEQKMFPLALYYAGSGRRFVVASGATILPPQATARGGSDDLARIAAIRADVPLPTAPEVFDAMVRPLAVDSLGTEVFGVQVSPNLVRVRVHFAAAKR